MQNDWLRLGKAGINPSFIVGYNLDATYSVLECPPEGVDGAALQELKDQRGVQLVLAADVGIKRYCPWFEGAEEWGGHTVLSFADGTPEAEAIRAFFAGPADGPRRRAVAYCC